MHLPNVVPQPAIQVANAAIDADLTANYDPSRRLEYIHRTFCPALKTDPRIVGLLKNSRARAEVDRVIPFERLWGSGRAQIAIRQARSADGSPAPSWHLDGVPTAHNGMLGKGLWTFTALVGIFLTTTPGTGSGNFTVWPESHRQLQQWFAKQGRRSLRLGQPHIDPGPARQLITSAGDIVICNYLLAHGACPNASEVERRAVFFRLGLPGTVTRRWHHLRSPWTGWRTVPRAAPPPSR